ncbi:transposase [Streptomyces sp. NPDC002387]|nr:transposase [Streptomyces sp. WAC07094]
MGRGDLSEDQWAVLEPMLPAAMRGRPAVGRRRLINGIRWRVRTGAP